MKTLPDEAVSQLEGRRPTIAGAMRFQFSDTYRLWTGKGELLIGSDVVPFSGCHANAILCPIQTSKGGAAEGLTVTFSGMEPKVAEAVNDEQYRGKPATVWRLVFAADGFTLLGAAVFMRGRVDTINIRERVGGDAAIDIIIEGPRRDMGRSGARIRSNSDQRVLGGALDGSCRHIGVAGRKVLSWGQKPAVASTALPGVGILGIARPTSFTITRLFGRPI